MRALRHTWLVYAKMQSFCFIWCPLQSNSSQCRMFIIINSWSLVVRARQAEQPCTQNLTTWSPTFTRKTSDSTMHELNVCLGQPQHKQQWFKRSTNLLYKTSSFPCVHNYLHDATTTAQLHSILLNYYIYNCTYNSVTVLKLLHTRNKLISTHFDH